jgi:hypothetical protein
MCFGKIVSNVADAWYGIVDGRLASCATFSCFRIHEILQLTMRMSVAYQYVRDSSITRFPDYQAHHCDLTCLRSRLLFELFIRCRNTWIRIS